MTRFTNQSIARKALIVAVVPTAAALVLISVAFLVSTLVVVRRHEMRDVAEMAAIVSEYITPALAANDPTRGGELLAALRRKSEVARACVFDAAGRLFAASGAAEDCGTATSPPRLSAGQVVASLPVAHGGRPLGAVRVVGNPNELAARLKLQAVVAIVATAVSAMAALLLVRPFQRAIVAPVTDLAATADRVSATRDYSLRASKATTDEVGRLVDSFNAMLAAIERAEHERNDLLEREQQVNRIKDEFLATVSHELRTPLNAILGWLQILKTGTPSKATRERALASLERNARLQTRLIEDLIEISRSTTGKLHLDLGVVDLGAVASAALDAINPTAAAKSIHVAFRRTRGPLLVSGDRERLQQVVWNVLSNAVKFTPAGGRMDVDLAADGGAYVLTVRDTGIGISPEFLPQVFERFRQGDGSTTREHGGLGLGLAIVREIVQMHDGLVTASSDGPGRGAAFTIRLPPLASTTPVTSADESERTAAPALCGIRIAAVDDDEDSLEVISAALRAAGAEVRTFTRGADAIADCEREPCDVLLCDLAMPQLDGFTVLDRLRRADAACGRRTIAIAVTAYETDDYRRRTRAAGFDGHIVKPFEVSELLGAIEAARQA